MLAGLKQTAPELSRLRQDATADLQRVVQEAFWLGLALVLIFLAGAVVAGLSIARWRTGGWGEKGRLRRPTCRFVEPSPNRNGL